MDVLPRITAQLFELFRSMSPMRRVASIAIAVGVVVAFGMLLVSNHRTDYQPVASGKFFVGDELSSAEQSLKSAGIVDFRRDGQRLVVPSKDLERSNSVLQDTNAQPADFGSRMLKQFETLGPFSTDRQRQQMKEALLLQELRSTIKQIPGIDDARVAIAYPDRRHGWNQKPRTTANVTLKSTSGYEITPSLVDSLRHVVANMVPDLKPVDVTVFDIARGHAYHGEQAPERPITVQQPADESLIAQYEQQIQKALSYIPNVSIAVQFVSNRETHAGTGTSLPTEERVDFDSVANRPAAISESDSHSTAFRGAGETFAAPGPTSLSSSDPRSRGLRVSVSIPRDYLRAVTARRASKLKSGAPDSDTYVIEDEVTATVERVVERLIPASSPHDAVSVIFVDRVSVERNAETRPIDWKELAGHVRRWRKEIGYVAAVIVALMVIWLIRRPTPSVHEIAVAPIPVETEETLPSSVVPEVVAGSQVAPPSVDRVALLRDEVRTLISSDSIAAAMLVGQMLPDVGSVASYSEVDGDRQVAILLLSLDQSLASELLGKLSREKVEQITFAIAKADNITREEQERVLSTFQSSFLSRPLLQPAGPETARILLERTLEQADVEPAIEKIEAQVEAGPFAFLHHRHANEIRHLIEDEHPQTIALVASQLSPSLAAQVFAEFPPEIQADLLGRVSRLGNTDLDVLADIATLLHARLGRMPAQPGGVRHAAKILRTAETTHSESLLKAIETRDSGVADALKDELFAFADLAMVDDATLRMVMQRSDQYRWAVAMKGLSPALRQRILSCVASPLAMALKREINSLGPLPLSEITVVQRQIAAAVRDLATEEGFQLPSSNSSHRTRSVASAVNSRDRVVGAKRIA